MVAAVSTKEHVGAKQHLEALASLSKQSREAIYQRAMHLKALLEDKQWIEAKYKGDQADAGEELGRDYFSDLYGGFSVMKLYYLACTFPHKTQWEKRDYNLTFLYADYKEATTPPPRPRARTQPQTNGAAPAFPESKPTPAPTVAPKPTTEQQRAASPSGKTHPSWSDLQEREKKIEELANDAGDLGEKVKRQAKEIRQLTSENERLKQELFEAHRVIAEYKAKCAAMEAQTVAA